MNEINSRRPILSARGINLLVIASSAVSVLLYSTGVTALLPQVPWAQIDRPWIIIMPILLTVAAVVCFIESGTNYKDTPHCSLTQNIEDLLKGENAEGLDHLDICEGGLRYLSAQAVVAGVFSICAVIPFAFLYYLRTSTEYF